MDCKGYARERSVSLLAGHIKVRIILLGIKVLVNDEALFRTLKLQVAGHM